MKEVLLDTVKEQLDERMQNAWTAMQAAQASANSESKSSAGDKYETARAMGQLDRDMHARMYEQARQERAMVERIDLATAFQKGAFGALLQTTMGTFFLAVSIGKLMIEKNTVMVISPQSPVGALLLGKQQGDTFTFRGVNYTIDAVS